MTTSLQKHLFDYLASATVVTALLLAAFAVVAALQVAQAALTSETVRAPLPVAGPILSKSPIPHGHALDRLLS